MADPGYVPPEEFDFDGVFEPEQYSLFWQELVSDEQTEREIAFLKRECSLQGSRRILDMPCGYGRHARRLAVEGHEVVGLDRSEGFISMARRDAADRGLDIKYVVGDMRNAAFPAPFDRLFMLFTAVGYFSEEDNLAVFRNAYDALRPGGIYCLDTVNRDALARYYQPNIVKEAKGDLAIDRHSFDPVSGRLSNRRIVVRSGRRSDTPYSIRLYNATELKSILAGIGFDDFRFFGDWRSAPLNLGSWRMIVVCARPEGSSSR